MHRAISYVTGSSSNFGNPTAGPLQQQVFGHPLSTNKVFSPSHGLTLSPVQSHASPSISISSPSHDSADSRLSVPSSTHMQPATTSFIPLNTLISAPIISIHPMTTRSRNGIYKPKDQPVTEYINLAERYLGFQMPGSIYTFTDAGDAYKRLSWTFEKEGTKLEWRWKCRPAPNSKEITAGLLDFLMDENIKLSISTILIATPASLKNDQVGSTILDNSY
ncbi:hypothetical protein Q3G72_012101 [Acer saccharum]|nr:hypothetical protein Q3G72_012101 [Acer saccharum]